MRIVVSGDQPKHVNTINCYTFIERQQGDANNVFRSIPETRISSEFLLILALNFSFWQV